MEKSFTHGHIKKQGLFGTLRLQSQIEWPSQHRCYQGDIRRRFVTRLNVAPITTMIKITQEYAHLREQKENTQLSSVTFGYEAQMLIKTH